MQYIVGFKVMYMSYAQISYYYRKSFVNFKMNKPHCHSKYNYEIMYVSSGKCEVILSERTVTLNAGNYIIIGRQHPHLLKVQSADVLNIEFCIQKSGVPIEDIEADFPKLSLIFAKEFSVYSDSGEVYTAIRELIDELQNHGNGIGANLLFKRMLIELCRNDSRNHLGGISYISNAKKYIEAHLCEKITVPEIAAHVGINRSYFQTLFKQHTGKTVVDYINSLRIERACFIMRNTEHSVTDIALDCGFSSRQHFMYIFRKHMGKTAREYRKL